MYRFSTSLLPENMCVLYLFFTNKYRQKGWYNEEDFIEYLNEWVFPEEQSVLVENLGIVKAAVATKAIPNCNIKFFEGAEMKTVVSGYLQTLYDQNPKAVGGTMPADDFYYAR